VSELSLSVVVPTLRRPAWLLRCLEGLERQERPIDQVVVVRREDDRETEEALRPWGGRVDIVIVHAPGVLVALGAGAAAAAGDVIAFTDDDAVPRAEWARRLLQHYVDPTVGGVGGRDVIPGQEGPTVRSRDAVRLSRWGRLSAVHHLGEGEPVDVEVLKGVNMSFRRQALRLPSGLRGTGAQVHNELAASLQARRDGWRLVYDPSVLVDHHPAPRFDADGRDRAAPEAVAAEAYNLVAVLTTLRPDLRRRRAAYGLAVGDAATPGLLRGTVAVLRGEESVRHRTVPSLRGQWAALRDVRKGPTVRMQSPSD
jgi:cellulose synthase/poly-beta-1,6-N-acetylglucosamine synthase-like glycosyltransferase